MICCLGYAVNVLGCLLLGFTAYSSIQYTLVGIGSVLFLCLAITSCLGKIHQHGFEELMANNYLLNLFCCSHWLFLIIQITIVCFWASSFPSIQNKDGCKIINILFGLVHTYFIIQSICHMCHNPDQRQPRMNLVLPYASVLIISSSIENTGSPFQFTFRCEFCEAVHCDSERIHPKDDKTNDEYEIVDVSTQDECAKCLCHICLQSMHSQTVTAFSSCIHHFHAGCWNQMVQHKQGIEPLSSRCPVCRKLVH